MNTKIYKSVHNLAGELMAAANKDDQETFDSLYAVLKAICLTHENTEKDHPVQWETLADFTEDLSEAITIYQKALAKATAINSKDFMSSIAYAMATLQVELGQRDAAIENIKSAKTNSNKIADKDLKAEIHASLEELLPSGE